MKNVRNNIPSLLKEGICEVGWNPGNVYHEQYQRRGEHNIKLLIFLLLKVIVSKNIV